MKRILAAILTLSALALFGCASPSEDNIASIQLTITPSKSETLYIIVNQPVECLDDTYDPEFGVGLSLGKYNLEGENADYWFFHAEKPISISHYDFGRKVGGTRIPGGLALSKDLNNPKTPPYIYADGNDPSEKMLIWKPGAILIKDRGEKWHLSTDETANP